MSALLIRPMPHRTEGPNGYLMRLAQENRLTITDLHGLGVSYDPDGLMRHGLLPQENLDPDLWAWVRWISTLKSKQGRMWNSKYARFCPLCLKDEPVWRAPWELYFHDACLTHGVWLIDRCSSCNQVLRWNREELLRCDCGADLRAEEAFECPREVRSLAGILNFRLKRHHHDLIPEPLDTLDIEEIQRLVRFLGTYLDPARGKKPLKLRNAGLMEASWPVTSMASALMESWPESFEAGLSKILAQSSDQPRGLRNVFMHAYQYLYKGLKGGGFDPIRQAFEVWLVEHWVGGIARRNKRLSAGLLKLVKWIPAKLAAQELGVSTRRIHQLVSENQLEGQAFVRGASNRTYFLVRRDQLSTIEQIDINEMDMKAVMAALGIGKVRMRQILTLLFPSAYRPKTKNGFSTWRVNRAEVEKYLEIGRDLPVVPIPDEPQVSFQYVLKYWCWNGEEIVDLVEAVRDGRISILAMLDGATGLGRWIFDAHEIRLWRQNRNVDLSNWLSIPEAAKAMNSRQDVLYWLTNNDFIQAEKLPRVKGVGQRISRAELERFKTRYVFGTEIAALLGVSPRKAVVVLGEEGFEPASGTGLDKCRQVFYARTSELMAFVDSAKHGENSVGKSKNDETKTQGVSHLKFASP